MRIILFILFSIPILLLSQDDNRYKVKYQIERCLNGGGVPVQGCWIYTDVLGRQSYITTQQALDSLLDAGLRDTIIAYGGVSGLTEDWVLYAKSDGTIDQDAGFRRIGTDSLVIDSTLTINGVSGLTPTTVKVLRDGVLEFDRNTAAAGVWMRLKPLQQTENNPNFNFNIESATSAFSTRNNDVMSFGWNLTAGGTREKSDQHAMGLSFENNFTPSANDTFAEFHYRFVDLSGVEYRPLTIITDIRNKDDWYGANSLNTWYWIDPTSGLRYAQLQKPSTFETTFDLVGSAANQGVQIYVNSTANYVSLANVGLGASAEIYLNQFSKTYVDLLNLGDLGPNPADRVLGRETGTNDVTDVPLTDGIELTDGNLGLDFPPIADTIAQYITFTNSITIQNPTASENRGMFYTDHAITIDRVSDAVLGTTPSVTYNIRFASTRNSGTPTDVFSANRTASTEAGTTTTTITGDATIPADQWVWLITSAASGTINDFNVTVQYTQR